MEIRSTYRLYYIGVYKYKSCHCSVNVVNFLVWLDTIDCYKVHVWNTMNMLFLNLILYFTGQLSVKDSKDTAWHTHVFSS